MYDEACVWIPLGALLSRLEQLSNTGRVLTVPLNMKALMDEAHELAMPRSCQQDSKLIFFRLVWTISVGR